MGKIVALERTNKHFENVAHVQVFGSGDDTTSLNSRLNYKQIEFKELLLLILASEYIVCPSAIKTVKSFNSLPGNSEAQGYSNWW